MKLDASGAKSPLRCMGNGHTLAPLRARYCFASVHGIWLMHWIMYCRNCNTAYRNGAVHISSAHQSGLLSPGWDKWYILSEADLLAAVKSQRRKRDEMEMEENDDGSIIYWCCPNVPELTKTQQWTTRTTRTSPTMILVFKV
ncbi:hypothetical protein PAXRUDRAFT_824588 [Paxillus rubicundulus Ve08.2h10]|uniref:Uncharacterized protein n=1 Tax=Paxillus rubicundulus Ve08.2h10 TaxID=930991 RepID=A0A0D0E7L0_9AGAM|nr:hypothetical protein PAXRUDRAFT_824588 [Paxillus rubicundulus Ve08.2h10]